MRFRLLSVCTRGAAILACASACAVSSAASLFGIEDPFNVESRTAPSPQQPWTPDRALPQAPPLTVPPELLAELNRPLSLAQLTEVALRLNLRTRQAWLSARAEAAQWGVDHAGDLPQVAGLISDRIARNISATSGLPNTTLIDQSGSVALPPRGQSYSVFTQYGPSLSFSYILYDFGRRAADKEATEYRILAANLAQNRALQEVAFQVEQAYYRVLGLEALVRASGESLKNFETALDATQRRRDSGLATAGDVYRAETQVGQAQLVLSRNQGELSKARGALANTVGLPVNFDLRLQPVSELPPVEPINQSVDALLTQAKTSRPDLVAAEARARAARATARAEAKAGLPSVELAGQYGRVNFTNTLTEQDVYGVGINVRIPIFSGFGDTYRARRREEEASREEANRDQAFLQTELDVWQAYFDLQTASTSIVSSANLVRSAGESAAAAVARYGAGVGSLLDLITAQVDDTNARVQQIQSYLDWYQALARLNFALGASDRSALRGKTP